MKELKKYQEEVLTKARQTMPEDDLEYVTEDLSVAMYTGNRRIPCFCRYCCEEPGRKSLYWIQRLQDTSTEILLLESTQNYNQQIENSGGAVSDAEKELLLD